MRTHTEITHRSLFALAWPITVGMLSHTAMALADTLFVGHLGTAQLAAVGLATVVGHLVASIPYALYAGVRVRIAHASGAGEIRHARRLAWQGLWLIVPNALFAFLMVPAVGPLLWAMGGSEEVVQHGTDYLQTRLAVMPALFAFFALQAWFQGRGNTRVPMVAVLIGNAVNIALDPLLIYGWGFEGFGVAGASLATGVAWSIEVVVLAAFAWRTLAHRRFGWNPAAVREVVRVGAPMAVHFVLDVGSFMLFVALLAGVGDEHLAAHVIVVRILAVSFLPGDSLAQAAGVLVGQRLGARDPEGARRAFLLATLQASSFMTAMGAVFLLAPGPLVRVFGPSLEVSELATGVLALAAVIQVFDAIAMVALGALNGAGDTRFTMFSGLSAAWLVKLPVSIAGVALGFGLWGAWTGVAAEIVVLAVVGLWRIRGTAWLEAEVGKKATA